MERRSFYNFRLGPPIRYFFVLVLFAKFLFSMLTKLPKLRCSFFHRLVADFIITRDAFWKLALSHQSAWHSVADFRSIMVIIKSATSTQILFKLSNSKSFSQPVPLTYKDFATPATAHQPRWLLTNSGNCPLTQVNTQQLRCLPTNSSDCSPTRVTTHQLRWLPTNSGDCSPTRVNAH